MQLYTQHRGRRPNIFGAGRGHRGPADAPAPDPGRPARTVVCPGCEADCIMPVQTIPAGPHEAVRFIVCDKHSDINRTALTTAHVERFHEACGGPPLHGHATTARPRRERPSRPPTRPRGLMETTASATPGQAPWPHACGASTRRLIADALCPPDLRRSGTVSTDRHRGLRLVRDQAPAILDAFAASDARRPCVCRVLGTRRTLDR